MHEGDASSSGLDIWVASLAWRVTLVAIVTVVGYTFQFCLSWCMREMHLSLAGHLLLTCHTLLGTVFVIGSLHTLSSVMMHEGDASFLVGHLWLVSIVSPW